MLPGAGNRTSDIFSPPSIERAPNRDVIPYGSSSPGFELPGPAKDIPQNSAVELKILNSESSFSDSFNPSPANHLKKDGHGSPHSSASFYGTGDIFSISCEHRTVGRRRRVLEMLSSVSVLISFFAVAALVLNFTFDSLQAAEKVYVT